MRASAHVIERQSKVKGNLEALLLKRLADFRALGASEDLLANVSQVGRDVIDSWTQMHLSGCRDEDPLRTALFTVHLPDGRQLKLWISDSETVEFTLSRDGSIWAGATTIPGIMELKATI